MTSSDTDPKASLYLLNGEDSEVKRCATFRARSPPAAVLIQRFRLATTASMYSTGS
jgi:hypothetical protein